MQDFNYILKDMPSIAWLALGGTLLTAGDILLKSWVERSLPYFSAMYLGGLAIYIVGLIFLIESFRTENIAAATAIFVLINIATLAVVSWLYFGDKISLLQFIGLLLAAAAVVLLEFGK